MDVVKHRAVREKQADSLRDWFQSNPDKQKAFEELSGFNTLDGYLSDQGDNRFITAYIAQDLDHQENDAMMAELLSFDDE